MKSAFLFRGIYTLLMLLLLVFTAGDLKAQVMGYPTSNNINAQLRHLFGAVAQPSPAVPVFYDMAAHFADTSWYVNYNNDTSNTTNFVTIYDEMYCAHYDTTQFLRVDTMYNRAQRFGSDTVPIGLIDYMFAKLKPGALYDSMWFYVDTLNNQLIDNPNAANQPYLINNIFTVAPLKDYLYNGRVVFRIDPAFMFIDNENMNKYSQAPLLIDFGDGNGWVAFNPAVVTHHVVTYTSLNPVRTIKASVTYNEGIDRSLSMARVIVPPQEQTTPPDEVWEMHDMTIGVYSGCSDNGDRNKFVIYLEGFDYFNMTDPTEIYEFRIKQSGISQLRNHGYTFLAVSWNKPSRSIKKNAESLAHLIAYLKCNFIRTQDPEPYVIIGESMGGIVARYALASMEKHQVDGDCYPHLMHNCRLYISVDAPHQGAYVPLAFQELYKLNPLFGYPFNTIKKFNEKINVLYSDAACELMNLHVANQDTVNNIYLPHPARNALMSDLLSFTPDGYPQHVKMVSLSNGLFTGEHQLGNFDDCIAMPGDDMVDLDADLNMHVLGFPLTGLYFDVNLKRLNPGQDFFTMSAGMNLWTINLKWQTYQVGIVPFAVKITIPSGFTIGYLNKPLVFRKRKTPSNIPVWENMPGGKASLYIPQWGAGQHEWASTNLLGLDPSGLSLSYNWGNNSNPSPSSCTHESVYSMDLDILTVSLDVRVKSQGLSFCFVPVQSAIDYSKGAAKQDHNIFADNAGVTMSRTPFDVIYGEVNGGAWLTNSAYPQAQHTTTFTKNNYRFPAYNQPHPRILNHHLTDSLLENSTPGNIQPALWLNREIGDEELWLENWNLKWDAKVQAEYFMHGGKNLNPHYTYPSKPADSLFKIYAPNQWFSTNPAGLNLQSNGIFSKDDPLTVQGGNTITLLYDSVFNDQGILGNYNTQNVPMMVCDQRFRLADLEHASKVLKESEVRLYPNPSPVHGSIFLTGLTAGVENHVKIYNLQGSILFEQKSFEKVLEINTGFYNLAPGLYVMVVNQPSGTLTCKFTLQ